MSYRINYIDRHGRKLTKVVALNEAQARGWTEALSKDNGGREAQCVHIADGPYDHGGAETHIITVGRKVE